MPPVRSTLHMALNITTHFTFDLPETTDVLLQYEVAMIPEQEVIKGTSTLPAAVETARVPAEDYIGERLWLRGTGHVEVHYEAQVKVERMLAEIAGLAALDMNKLPGEAVPYLFDSRYCPANRLQGFVEDRFGQLSGGERIIAMRDWVHDNFTYTAGASGPTTTAIDTLIDRRGVCRDYAHVMVAFARASAIPARFVSCYAPGVEPQDFHAIAEVFLADPSIPGGGAWHLVDATGMADPAKTAKIGVGRDAADVSFMTAFGIANFGNSSIEVNETGH